MVSRLVRVRISDFVGDSVFDQDPKAFFGSLAIGTHRSDRVGCDVHEQKRPVIKWYYVGDGWN